MSIDEEQPSDARLRINWGWVFVVGAVLFVGVMLLLPALQAPGKRGHSPCYRNLNRIGRAMLAYYENYKCFPPAFIADEQGQPKHSWRLLILPYFRDEELKGLYEQYSFDEPWNSPQNLALADKISEVYRCAKDTNASETDTSYVMIVGTGSISDGPHATKLQDISDRASNTIMVVEMSESGIRWTEPRDLSFDEMSFKINSDSGPGIRSEHLGGAHIVTCDACVHYLSEQIPPELLKGLLTIAGGEEVSDDW